MADVSRRLGTRTHHGRIGRRSQRYCHLFPSRRAVRLQSRVDAAIHLSAHVRDPVDQRPNRQGHRARASWKYPSLLSHVAPLSARWSAYNRQYDQSRSRSRRNGRGASPARRRSRDCLRRWVRDRHCTSRGFHKLRPLRLGAEMVNLVALRLRWHGVRGRRALVDRRKKPCAPAYQLRWRLSDSRRRGIWHDDQPLSLLLAGCGGGGGGAGRPDGRAAHPRAQPSASPDGAHASRYARWNGLLKYNRPFHHADNGGDTECSRRHRHSNLVPGGRGAAPDRRPLRLHDICSRHYWHRDGRGARVGRQRCLRGRRDAGVEGWIGPTPWPRASILRHDRISHLNRRNSELYAARSDQGLVLERGHKRSRCGSNHGSNHADGFAKSDHGTVRTTAVAEGPWLASARRNGGCSGWHVRDVGKLIGPPIDPEFWEERPQPGMSSWSNDRPYHYRDNWTRRISLKNPLLRRSSAAAVSDAKLGSAPHTAKIG